MLPESLRGSDKRRNGPEFPNDTKKRKVDDKDSSHYVRNGSLNTMNVKSYVSLLFPLGIFTCKFLVTGCFAANQRTRTFVTIFC